MFLFTLTFNVKFTLNIKSVVLKLYYGMTPISGTDRFLCLVNPLSAKVAKLRQDVILNQIDRSSLYGVISHLYSLPLDGRHEVLRF